MCGIAGLVDVETRRSRDLGLVVGRMADVLVHRGPDDSGVWCDPDTGVALGHRRLAVVDLSKAGAQPMQDRSGRFRIVYNGEVYNHPQLRTELAGRGVRFRGSSDTEVLVESIACWGFDRALRKINGMFAVAAWDSERRVLHLARDALGEKPLYWFVKGGRCVFASELKALREVPELALEVDVDAVALFLQLGYIPAPRTIYRGVAKLTPGTAIDIAVSRSDVVLCKQRRYWSLQHVVEQARRDPFPGTPDEAVEEVTRLLSESVRIRLEADVPVGAFLSGGIDSSLIA
ncbi:MAG: asparagine synthase (glutamine-hydrolyzing), partial [Halanaerobiales bacterium]|nr:asparagine synthase (glutamine-hydrolyzing) [Halanaerobiales bacterium]